MTSEHYTLGKCVPLLESTLRLDATAMASYLFSQGLITDSLYEEILDPRSTFDGAEKATKLVIEIMRKVKLEPGNYYKFINHLRQDMRKYGDIVDMLDAEYFGIRLQQPTSQKVVSSDDLHKELTPIKDKWYSIGTGLKVPSGHLNKFHGLTDPLMEVIIHWLKGSRDTPPSWEGMVLALKEPGVDEAELAEKIDRLYCDHREEKKAVEEEQAPPSDNYQHLEDASFEKYKLKRKTRDIKRSYSKFLAQLHQQMLTLQRNGDLSVAMVKSHMISYDYKLKAPLSSCSSLSEILKVLTSPEHCTFWDYDLIEVLHDLCDTEKTRSDFAEYEKTLKDFFESCVIKISSGEEKSYAVIIDESVTDEIQDLNLFHNQVRMILGHEDVTLVSWENRNLLQKSSPTAAMPLSQEEFEKQRVCERVLKAKSLVTIIIVIFNYLGLPRSGKTSFRRRITGEIENILKARQQGEVEQPSTGVLENGGQVIIKPSCLETGVIRSKVWSVLNGLSDEANMLNQFFDQIVPASDSMVAKKKKAQSNAQSKERFFASDGEQAAKSPSPTSDLKKATDTDDVNDDEMFSIIREAMATDHREEVEYLLDDTILLVNNDTGGHAEFLDLQAILVQGPSFSLLFSRLVDDMDSLFKIYYTNEEGTSTDKEDSTMTVEEVLFQSLSSIACFSGAFSTKDGKQLGESQQSQSTAMLVGTHLDMVSEKEFKAKDQHLRKRIESTEFFKKSIVEYASEDQLMLAVNNLSGDQADIKGIKEILERVIEKNFAKISIPATWLVLSLYLRKKQFPTISLKECEELAGKLGIDPEELQDALWFLHHRVGVLLYYPKVEAMKDMVICQMQVVFDSASNLIRNTFTFERVGQYASKKFREKGQFSLKDVKRAVSGHTDSPIPLEKLIMLLQYLNVLTHILPASSEESPHTPEPTYFMPCVLQSARASELTITSTSEDPAPLMLHYECGYVPVGVFPAMITNLVSQSLNGWTLVQKGLCKNRVQFRVGENYDVLTLISRPRYFEISLSQNPDNEVPIPTQLCVHVRVIIQSTLDTVTSHMNYHFKMGYKFGFECPIHPGREHLSVLASENAKLMQCLESPEEVRTVRLKFHHKVWFFKKGGAAEVSIHNLSELSEVTPTNHARLMKILCQHAAHWEDIASCLGFSQDSLDNIRAAPLLLADAPASWLRQVLNKWISRAEDDPRGAPTLGNLRKAVAGAGLGGIKINL